MVSVISNFKRLKANRDITEGKQTFICYVSDMVDGLIKLASIDFTGRSSKSVNIL